MLTEFVLANVAVGGMVVMTSPLLFQGLLELRYPPGFRGEAADAPAEVLLPLGEQVDLPRVATTVEYSTVVAHAVGAGLRGHRHRGRIWASADRGGTLEPDTARTVGRELSED
jgi:hypothetical protein